MLLIGGDEHVVGHDHIPRQGFGVEAAAESEHQQRVSLLLRELGGGRPRLAWAHARAHHPRAARR